jgi:hypothetical protein
VIPLPRPLTTPPVTTINFMALEQEVKLVLTSSSTGEEVSLYFACGLGEGIYLGRREVGSSTT